MSQNGSKTSTAYDVLKDLFRNNQFDKNRIIPTSEIAESINIGRAPVIEALKRLETERYVKIIPQKGVMVREMTIQEMRDINDMRIALECFITKKIASSFDSADANNIEVLLAGQRDAMKSDSPKVFIKFDEEFHLYLCKKSGNELLIEEMQRLRERFFTVGLHILMQPTRMLSTLEEHETIVDALKKHDAEAAVKAMEYHLENGKKRIV